MQFTGQSLVPGACYYKVTFQIQTEERSFVLPLYLSPDQRYVARDLAEIRPAFNAVTIPLQANPAAAQGLAEGAQAILGSKTAPVTVVVFSDFQCPYCKKAAEWLRAEMGALGPDKLRVVFRYFPLAMHSWARPAAEAAACAGNQSQAAFWKVHDSIFANQAGINAANAKAKLLEYARPVPGLDMAAYQRCFESGTAADVVRKDEKLGASYQVRGTPAVFVNGQRLPGLRSSEQLHAAIEQVLSGTTRAAAMNR